MPRRWIATLLPALTTLEQEEARGILRRCAASHYDDLGMGAMLGRFRGDLPSFLDFLRQEWGWIISYDAKAGVVVVDENKSYCVCPLVSPEHSGDLGVLCYCSEGFAERMFSAVTGCMARAEVTESILRGGTRCRYRVEMDPCPSSSGG